MLRRETAIVRQTEPREYPDKKVFFKVFGRKPELIVCGGGHVAIAVIRLAGFLLLPVTVIEDRPLFADQAREAMADRVICDSFDHALEGIAGGPDNYFIIVTRGHRYDKVCLESILDKPSAYVGIMGSRRRVGLLKDTLKEEGDSEEALDLLHALIGLSTGSETPEEIAVSILGEIIQRKNEKKGAIILTDGIIEGLQRPEEKVLAMIVMRKGSAPRQIGTEMLIFRDGRTIGTIGGGCAESEVIWHSLEILMSRSSCG